MEEWIINLSTLNKVYLTLGVSAVIYGMMRLFIWLVNKDASKLKNTKLSEKERLEQLSV